MRYTPEEKNGTWISNLWSLHLTKARDSNTLNTMMQLRKGMLGINWSPVCPHVILELQFRMLYSRKKTKHFADFISQTDLFSAVGLTFTELQSSIKEGNGTAVSHPSRLNEQPSTLQTGVVTVTTWWTAMFSLRRQCLNLHVPQLKKKLTNHELVNQTLLGLYWKPLKVCVYKHPYSSLRLQILQKT